MLNKFHLSSRSTTRLLFSTLRLRTRFRLSNPSIKSSSVKNTRNMLQLTLGTGYEDDALWYAHGEF